jgi:photosynthetic reaction center cytochrome c subunit
MKQVNLALAGATALFLAAAAHGIAFAQAPGAAPPPAGTGWRMKNPKVFPADITRAQLVATMKGFTQALGVRCTFCHVGTEGQPLSTYDFASDAKPEKEIARSMLRMVGDLNGRVLPAIPGLKDAKVTCFTCHRGDSKPAIAPPPPPAVPPPPPPGT